MIDRGKKGILGVEVNVIDYDSVLERTIHAAQTQSSLAVSATAVHGLMIAALNPIHRYRLNRFDIVTPDGQPVRWALGLLHGEWLPDRVYGPDLTLRVCERASQLELPIYLYGGQQQVLDKLRAKLVSRYPSLKIVGAEASRFRRLTEAEEHELDRRVTDSGACLMLIGLGCPRQEIFVYERGTHLQMPLLAVGAAFDFHAGYMSQAPSWMQRIGLEWLYRMSKEPSRLWRRYILLNPLYCLLVALQMVGIRQWQKPESAPTLLDHYG